MTEYQSIAIGLLGLTHPEIYLSVRNGQDKSSAPAAPASSSEREPQEPKQARQPRDNGTHSSAVRAVKFAFAALVAGSRAVPLGDNGQLIRELGAYGERLSH